MFVQKLWKIIIGVFTLVSILIVSASGINANAATTTQAVGQNKTFTVTYFNAQNEPGSNPMSLEIYIGNQLQIDVNSFRDTFSSGTANCINPAFFTKCSRHTTSTIKDCHLDRGNTIKYKIENSKWNINLNLF